MAIKQNTPPVSPETRPSETPAPQTPEQVAAKEAAKKAAEAKAQKEKEEKATQETTATDATKLDTQIQLKDLEVSMKDITPETLATEETRLTPIVRDLDLSRLKDAKEGEKHSETVQQYIVGVAAVLMKLAQKKPDTPLEDLDALLKKETIDGLDVLTGFEKLLLHKLRDARDGQENGKTKKTHETIKAALFGDWKDDIAKIRAKETSPINSALDWIGKLYKDNEKTIGGVTAIAALGVGAMVLWQTVLGPLFDLFSGKAKTEGVNPWNILGIGAVVGGGVIAASNWDAINNAFGGFLKSLTPGAKPDEGTDTSGVKKGPLRDVWKNYEKDMETPMNKLKGFFETNKTASIGAGLYGGAKFEVLRSAIMAGGGYSVHAALEMAKLPFATTAAHPGLLLLLPAMVGGGKLAGNALGDVKVPVDMANMRAFLQEQYHEFLKEHKDAGLPEDLGEMELAAMENIISGKEHLGDYYKNVSGLFGSLATGAVDKLSISKEKLVQDKNVDGLKVWSLSALKPLSANETNGEGYKLLSAKVDAIITEITHGGKLTAEHLDALKKINTEQKLGISFELQGNMITAFTPSDSGTGQMNSFNIGINPATPLEAQAELATVFYARPDASIPEQVISGYANGVWNSFRLSLHNKGKDTPKDIKEGLPEEMEKGNIVLSVLGDTVNIISTSTWNYVTVPFRMVSAVPKLFSGEFHAAEFAGMLGTGLVAGMVVGSMKEIQKVLTGGPKVYLNHIPQQSTLGRVAKNIFWHGVFGPVHFAIDLYKARTGAKILTQGKGLDWLVKNPLNIALNRIQEMRTRFMQHTTAFEFHGGVDKMYNTKLSAKYGGLNSCYQVLTKLQQAKFELNPGNKFRLIEEAEHLADRSILKDLIDRSHYGELNVDNYGKFLDEVKDFTKNEEKNLKSLSDLIKMKSVTKEAGKLAQIEAKIAALADSKGHHIDVHDILPTAPRTPGLHLGGHAPELNMHTPHSGRRLGPALALGAIGLAAVGLNLFMLPDAKADEARKEKEAGFWEKMPESVMKKLERAVTLGTADVGAIMNPEHLKSTPETELIEEVNNAALKYKSGHDILLHILKGKEDQEAFIKAFKDSGMSEVTLGPSYKLTYAQGKLELISAEDEAFKVEIYDMADGIRLKDTVEKMSLGLIKDNDIAVLGGQTVANSTPFLATILDLGKLKAAKERGLNMETAAYSAWAAAGILDFIPATWLGSAAARGTKMARIVKYAEKAKQHSALIHASLFGVDVARILFRPKLSVKEGVNA